MVPVEGGAGTVDGNLNDGSAFADGGAACHVVATSMSSAAPWHAPPLHPRMLVYIFGGVRVAGSSSTPITWDGVRLSLVTVVIIPSIGFVLVCVASEWVYSVCILPCVV